jgi:hypothetical protein
MMAVIEAIQSERLDAPNKGVVIRELVAEALEARRMRSGRRSCDNKGNRSGELFFDCKCSRLGLG